jgi:23S rRNA (uracil1939-C5)-methyltransferase
VKPVASAGRIDAVVSGRYRSEVEKRFRRYSPARGKPAREAHVSFDARHETAARCPHYPHCVGCPFIDVPYPEQLSRKRSIVRTALAEYPRLAALELAAVVPSPERLGYRARVKLVVRRNRAHVAMGLYVPQTHRVMDISSCPVHPRPVNQVAHWLKTKVAELGIAPYDERDDSGDLRYVDFRYSAARRELSVTLVSRHPSLPKGEQLARSLMNRFSFITGVIQNINEERGNVIWGPSFRTLAGRDTLMERIGDVTLVLPPGVFSQANPFTARKIYEHVRNIAALEGRETVLDLYCGVGPISLYLATAARQVWAVDDSELSINTAKQNARRNGRGNCRFIAGDVAATVAQLRETLSAVDRIVLNPPRKGVQPPAMAEIIALNAPRLVYVSCEPRTLARDLDHLITANYRVHQIQPFDMFPQTEQVETVALLMKEK